MRPYDITARQRGASPQRLACLAASPAAALLIGRAAFPGSFITVSTRLPFLPLPIA